MVLFPGAAHISRIVSCGWGSKAKTQSIEGKFCNKAEPGGKNSSPSGGHPDIVSAIWTATPLLRKIIIKVYM